MTNLPLETITDLFLKSNRNINIFSYMRIIKLGHKILLLLFFDSKGKKMCGNVKSRKRMLLTQHPPIWLTKLLCYFLPLANTAGVIIIFWRQGLPVNKGLVQKVIRALWVIITQSDSWEGISITWGLVKIQMTRPHFRLLDQKLWEDALTSFSSDTYFHA